ncbi:MarR family transcriptional regulator [Rhodococcus aerolatus]
MATTRGPATRARRGPGRPVAPPDALDAALLALTTAAVEATVHAGESVTPALSPTQVRVLTVLSRAPDGLSLGAVAAATSASAPSASRLCQRLHRAGLVDRDAGPGNELRLSLSALGRDTLAAVDRHRLGRLRPVLDLLDPADRAVVERGLRVLGEALDTDTDTDPDTDTDTDAPAPEEDRP